MVWYKCEYDGMTEDNKVLFKNLTDIIGKQVSMSWERIQCMFCGGGYRG